MRVKFDFYLKAFNEKGHEVCIPCWDAKTEKDARYFMGRYSDAHPEYHGYSVVALNPNGTPKNNLIGKKFDSFFMDEIDSSNGSLI